MTTEEFELEGAVSARARQYHIIVNGEPKAVHDRKLSFQEIVALAGDAVPSGPHVAVTVTFRNADQHPSQGLLVPGESVKIQDGTVFVVTATDKS
ncbi:MULTISPECIES: multiubiquitin domain-containing protein [unclassified Nonomuraea]|uniref:multiubiquitin domain-containing protein n=1 Tax=unclassified Nonomuraea TaxID=2593643 RepID=UPI0033F40DA9